MMDNPFSGPLWPIDPKKHWHKKKKSDRIRGQKKSRRKMASKSKRRNRR